jgi:hypothetical protein
MNRPVRQGARHLGSSHGNNAYRGAYSRQAAQLCQRGATDEELADYFKVTARTIYRWKVTQEKFCQAVIAGKVHADYRVERLLYNRAPVGCFLAGKTFLGELYLKGSFAPVRTL